MKKNPSAGPVRSVVLKSSKEKNLKYKNRTHNDPEGRKMAAASVRGPPQEDRAGPEEEEEADGPVRVRTVLTSVL